MQADVKLKEPLPPMGAPFRGYTRRGGGGGTAPPPRTPLSKLSIFSFLYLIMKQI